MKTSRLSLLTVVAPLFLIAVGAPGAHAQQPPPASAESPSLEQHLDVLSAKIDTMSQQLEQSHAEMEAMRAEISSLRSQLAEKDGSEQAAQTTADLRASVSQLQEKSDVLEAAVATHDQTKVESLSKYPVKIYGTMLFTSVSSSGSSDDIDLPIIAMPTPSGSSSGSFSATARQSILGVDASGPHLWGARSSADLSVDFFGGIPYGDYTTSSGTVRLRIAHATLDWPNQSLTVAVEQPLISPRNPTSWVTIAEPALAWSGNLWTWLPQLEYRATASLHSNQLTGSFALVDPAAPGPPPSNAARTPDASERSRQPGYEARVADNLDWLGHSFQFGVGGYYSRQDYLYNRKVDAWAGTADWSIPLFPRAQFSGELYRGRAIGGLGGGAFKDFVTYNNYTSLRGLDAEGGWGQLKFTLTPQLEANLAIGEDGAFDSELAYSDLATSTSTSPYSNLAKNQTGFGNIVYRPRTYLLFSGEFRQIRSWPIGYESYRDRLLGLSAGYLF
jgi:hypothetical protein